MPTKFDAVITRTLLKARGVKFGETFIVSGDSEKGVGEVIYRSSVTVIVGLIKGGSLENVQRFF